MINFFYVLQFIIAILLILLVIFQKSSSGTGLISSNQYNSMFSGKSLISKNPLTRYTIILGALLFINSIVIGGIHIANNKQAMKKISDIIQSDNEVKIEKTIEDKATKTPLGD